MNGLAGTGNGGFDLSFGALQISLLLASLVLVVIARRRGPGKRGLVPLQMAVGLAAGALVPLVWNLGWPPANGLEGAGRLIFGGAASGLNAIVCCAACALSPQLSVGGKILNGIAQLAAVAGYWGYFLLH